MNENERFEQLWDGLKEQVKAARGYSKSRQTMGTVTHRDSMRVSTAAPSERFDTDASYFHVSINGATVTAKATADDLRSIAAICIAGALDIEDAKP